MSQPETDTEEEQTSHRIIGMVIVHKRIDTVVDGWESEEGSHKLAALREIASECGVDASACEWVDDEAVCDVPIELAQTVGRSSSNYRPITPCLTCEHVVTEYVPSCVCLCHAVNDWASA